MRFLQASFFTLAITWPFASSVTDEGAGLRNLLKRARQQLQANPKAGMYLIVVGLIMFAINGFLPGPLRFVGTLFYFSAFAGVLYIYFTPKFPRKKLLLSLFGAFVVGNAIVGGMFTLVAYMGMTLFPSFHWPQDIIFQKSAGVLCGRISADINSKCKTYLPPVYLDATLRG
jgi:hypothetical protein